MGGTDSRVRVQDFVDWAIAVGVERGRANGHYRSIGAELIDRARGGRVNESHILAVSDAYDGRDELQTLVAEVGDAMLRFEELRKTGMRVPIPGRSESPPPSLITPAQAAASKTGAPVPRSEAPTARPGTLPARPATIGGRGTQFRCPKCKVMVAATAAGRCPQCGGEPPHVIAAPAEEAPKPVSRWWLRVGLAALLLVVAVLALSRLRSSVIGGRAPGEPVARWHGEAVPAAFTFPEGWRHLPGELTIPDTRTAEILGDHPLAIDPAGLTMAPLHLATFYRGASPPGETSRMMLGYAPSSGPQPGTPDERLLGGATALAAGVQRRTTEPECRVLDLPPRVGRCTVKVESGHVAVYLWEMKDGHGVGAVFHSGGPTQTEAEGDSVVTTVQPD